MSARHARLPRTNRWSARSRVACVLAVVATAVLMVAIVTLAAVFTYRHVAPQRSSLKPSQTPPPSSATTSAPPKEALEADFAALKNRLQARIGVAVSAVGNGQTPMALGDWQEGPAWSTIKVPLVIAAYRQQKPPHVTDTMRAAIIESDNAAAESIWETLGDPTTAAGQVQQILAEAGDPTAVESRKLRPEFTAFGQTVWSLVNQVRFTASAACNSENDPVFDLMGQVVPDQSWGIGGIPGTAFKGGWGPSPAGKYLVRQIGVLASPAGKVAVAIAAEPASGQFADGTQELGEVATWLTGHLAAMPAGQCGR
jgi:hypothetical protein